MSGERRETRSDYCWPLMTYVMEVVKLGPKQTRSSAFLLLALQRKKLNSRVCFLCIYMTHSNYPSSLKERKLSEALMVTQPPFPLSFIEKRPQNGLVCYLPSLLARPNIASSTVA